MARDKSRLVLSGSGRRKRWRKRDSIKTGTLATVGGLSAGYGRKYYLENKKEKAARVINTNKSKIGKSMTEYEKLRKVSNGQMSKWSQSARDELISKRLKLLSDFRRLNEESDLAAEVIDKANKTRFTPRNAAIAGVAAGAGLGVALYAARKVDQNKYHDINNKTRKERSYASSSADYAEALNSILKEMSNA